MKLHGYDCQKLNNGTSGDYTVNGAASGWHLLQSAPPIAPKPLPCENYGGEPSGIHHNVWRVGGCKTRPPRTPFQMSAEQSQPASEPPAPDRPLAMPRCAAAAHGAAAYLQDQKRFPARWANSRGCFRVSHWAIKMIQARVRRAIDLDLWARRAKSTYRAKFSRNAGRLCQRGAAPLPERAR